MNLSSSLILSSYITNKQSDQQPPTFNKGTHPGVSVFPTVVIAAFVNGDLGDGFRMMNEDMRTTICA
jgi:hypothetical protein